MILRHAADPPAFREALRAWLGEVLPSEWRERLDPESEEAYVESQRWWFSERRKVGLVLPGLPETFGGADLDLAGQQIMVEEFARAGSPSLEGALYMVSLTHVPATLLAWGTPEQQQAYLPGLLAGDVWCQGFSEPGAGSDLASLRTRAVREGDDYVINGQKVWSSFSRFAKYCLLLVRTDADAPKHKGITYLILQMDSPGVEVRPIRQATGHAEFSEIFLTDVRVPVANRIGPENDGWAVAQSTLAAERGVLAFERAERQRREIELFLVSALREKREWTRCDASRAEFAGLVAEMQAIRRMVRRLLREDGGDAVTRLPAIIKLLSTTLAQRYADFRVRTEGLAGQVYRPSLAIGGDGPMHDYLQSFGDTISAGSNEIMRNLIAERGLGLPRAGR
jgi:alkylation response protein AidB-like acyl-CoA dehydrogenase